MITKVRGLNGHIKAIRESGLPVGKELVHLVQLMKKAMMPDGKFEKVSHAPKSKTAKTSKSRNEPLVSGSLKTHPNDTRSSYTTSMLRFICFKRCVFYSYGNTLELAGM